MRYVSLYVLSENRSKCSIQDTPFLALTDNEVQLAACLCKAQSDFGEQECRIIAIDLKEPSKEEYLSWKGSKKYLDRKAQVIVYNTLLTTTFVYIVSLKNKRILSKKEVSATERSGFT
jgi:Cu2+-containing amine oxidase